MTVTPDSPIAELNLSRNLTDLLSRYNYGTVAALIARPRTDIAVRMVNPRDMAAIDAALTEHGLAFRSEVGEWALRGDCPTCPDCGNPRARTARSVVVGLDGRAGHLGARVAPVCEGCDRHHRALVADRAEQLVGSGR
jgi:hypothetical protein